jgi:hypothetical protein
LRLTKDLGSSINKMTSKGLSTQELKNFELMEKKTRFSKKINNTNFAP